MPFVAAAPPAAWAVADVAPPEVAPSSGARVTQWSVMRGAGEATFVAACVATPIPGWVEDMRPAVEARSVGLVASTAQRLAKGPIEASDRDGLFVIRRAGAAAPGDLGTARTFLGFDDANVFTCYAACVATSAGATRACDATVKDARLERSGPPPHPSMALSAVTFCVHHPRETAGVVATLTTAFGVLAIVTRRRPRATAK